MAKGGNMSIKNTAMNTINKILTPMRDNINKKNIRCNL